VGCVRLRTATGFAAALVLACAFPSVAAAADRFAEPGGDGAEPCAQTDPCDIETAVNDANQFDDITLLPGTYNTSVTLGAVFDPSFDPRFNLTIHGSPGARPVVNFSGASSSAFYIGIGSSLRDVDVNATGNVSSAFGVVEGGVAERVNAHASGSDAAACSVTGQSSVRDSVCWYSGSGGPNSAALVVGARYSDFNEVDTLRNVTAISANGPGILARSVTSINAGVTVNATNVIAQGGGGSADVRTERLTGVPTTPPQQVNLDHSNYATESEFASGDITDPGTGTNATNPPKFDDAAAGNFHQLDTSNGTIDLGTATGLQPQERDIDGEYRAMGTAPDIGADEFGTVPPPPTITGTDPPSGSNDNNPLVIGTAEPLSTVKVYKSSDCSGPEAGAEVAEEFASPGIIVSVPDDSTTTLTATAANGTTTSACSAPFTYTEVSTPPPPTLTPTPPSGGAPSQPVTVRKKKCKKKKHRAASVAKKKCKKKKR
jgi:hypothetical protein